MGIEIAGYQYKREGYFLIDREFELSEIRLLCDAVAASDMIKESSSKIIIKKLLESQSIFQSRKLQECAFGLWQEIAETFGKNAAILKKDKENITVKINTIPSVMENDMTVYIVIFDKAAYRISSKLFSDIASYIDDHYVETHINKTSEAMRRQKQFREMDLCESISLPEPSNVPLSKAATLEDALQQMDESFSEMLLRKIDESGMTDSQCYKKANIDRKLFSKIKNDKYYKPSKPTVLAFALALELPLPEIQDMLMKAGFALSHSSKFDVIVEYFILKQNYSIYEINEALFAFDQSLIGG